MNLISLAIQILWLALGIMVLCGVIWLALYAIKQFLPVPSVVERVIWIVVLILVLIGILTMLAGGGSGIRSPFRSGLSAVPTYAAAIQPSSNYSGGAAVT